MKPPVVSLEAVLLTVAGLWRATLLTTTWGQSDGATYLDASALNNERRTYNGTGIYIPIHIHILGGNTHVRKDDHPPKKGCFYHDVKCIVAVRGSLVFNYGSLRMYMCIYNTAGRPGGSSG